MFKHITYTYIYITNIIKGKAQVSSHFVNYMQFLCKVNYANVLLTPYSLNKKIQLFKISIGKLTLNPDFKINFFK